ncbi:MAG TPA: hypothetical protein VGL81_16590 [Polyangiaceae bacterium]
MPEPISLERFAELTARMTSGGKRDDVLKAADVDEALWDMSQQYWMGKMAAEAGRDRFSLAQRYGTLYKTAVARLSGIPMKLPRYPRKPQAQVVVHGVPAATPSVGRITGAPPAPASVRPSAGSPLSAAVVPPPASLGPLSAPPPSAVLGHYTARLTLEQLAAMRAEIGLAAEAEHPAVMQRFGLDPTAWEHEETHWQRKLAGDQDLFKRYLKQFQYCRSLLSRT